MREFLGEVDIKEEEAKRKQRAQATAESKEQGGDGWNGGGDSRVSPSRSQATGFSGSRGGESRGGESRGSSRGGSRRETESATTAALGGVLAQREREARSREDVEALRSRPGSAAMSLPSAGGVGGVGGGGGGRGEGGGEERQTRESHAVSVPKARRPPLPL